MLVWYESFLGVLSEFFPTAMFHLTVFQKQKDNMQKHFTVVFDFSVCCISKTSTFNS